MFSFRVNRSLVWAKATYFCILGGIGCVFPFLAIYLSKRGMTVEEAGFIVGIVQLLGLFERPFVGAIADKTERHGTVYVICSIIFFVPMFSLIFITPTGSGSTEITETFFCNDVGVLSSTACIKRGVTESRCFGPPSGADANPVLPLDNQAGNTSIISYSPTDSGKAAVATGQCHVTCTSLDAYGALLGVELEFVPRVCVRNKTQVSSVSCLPEFTFSFTFDLDKNCSGYRMIVRETDGLTISKCEPNVSIECRVHCHDRDQPIPMKSLRFQQKHQQPTTNRSSFWVAFLLCAVGFQGFMPLLSMLDAKIFELLGPNATDYGLTRLWGTIGYAICAPLTGIINDAVGRAIGQETYNPGFYIFLALEVLMTFASIMVFRAGAPTAARQNQEADDTTHPDRRGRSTHSDADADVSAEVNDILLFEEEQRLAQLSFTQRLRELTRRFDLIVYLFTAAVLGALFGIIVTFGSIFLVELCAESTLIGIEHLVCAVLEFSVMSFSGMLIKRLGYTWCMAFVFGAYVLRFIGYGLLVNPWLVLLVDCLHGLTFGLGLPVIIGMANEHSPAGLRATTQGLMSGFHFSFGLGAGTMLTGFIYHRIGGRMTFFACSGVAAGFGAIFTVIQRCCIERRAQQQSGRNPEVQAGKDGKELIELS